jgi:HAD superfamily hydrolase (TIGR01509 family)
MPYQLLILDCDGVLVDSERLSHEVLVAMLAEEGLAMDMETAYGHFRGRTLDQCRETITRLLGRRLRASFEGDFRDRSAEAFRLRLTAVPGVEAALDRISLPSCVVSNGAVEKMRLTLGITGLLPRFDGRLFSGADLGKPKPLPDVFLHAARHFGVRPSDCVVVEDSGTGVRAAVSAHMTVFGYTALTPPAELLEAGARAVFASMEELPGLIQAGQGGSDTGIGGS